MSTLQLDVRGNWLCCLLEITMELHLLLLLEKNVSRKRLAVGLKPEVFTSFSALHSLGIN